CGLLTSATLPDTSRTTSTFVPRGAAVAAAFGEPPASANAAATQPTSEAATTVLSAAVRRAAPRNACASASGSVTRLAPGLRPRAAGSPAAPAEGPTTRACGL